MKIRTYKLVILCIFLFALQKNYSQITGGVYSIKDSGGDYISLSAAISDLNSNGLSSADDGDVIFEIHNNQSVTESTGAGYNINGIANSSSTNRVIIRPASGENPIITIALSAASRSGIMLNSSSHITFDGWNQDGEPTQNMTIKIQSYDGSVIRLADNSGVNNVEIKNLNIIGNTHNTANVSVGISASGTSHFSIIIDNNKFLKHNVGVNFSGVYSDTQCRLLTVTNNIFGADTTSSSDRISGFGIIINQYKDVIVRNNVIKNLSAYTSGQSVTGISFSIVDSLICDSNTIYNFYNSGHTYGISKNTFMSSFGLRGYKISNNIIENMYSSGSNHSVYGIHILNSEVNGSIDNNIIRNVYCNNYNTSPNGLYASTLKNNNIHSNKIYRIYNSNTANSTKSGRGIHLIGTLTNDTIYNNFIYAIGGGSSTSWSTSDASNFNNLYPFGILINSNDISNLKIFHNSIFLTKDAKTESSQTAAGVNSTSSYAGAIGINSNKSQIELKNNILYNTLNGDTLSAPSFQFPLLIYQSTNPFSSSDYNVYKKGRPTNGAWCSSNIFNGVAFINNFERRIDELRSFSGGDNNSIVHNPIINCAGSYCSANPMIYNNINDLHIAEDQNVPGVYVGINFDIDNEPRIDTYTIGADQWYNSALPVDLIDFKVEVVNNEIVKLTWATSSEINNDFFSVERSRDAINFELIANINGNGNSNVPIHYSFVDYRPYSGISYYRIKQTDFDRNYSYSPIKQAYIGTLDIVNIYPNPSIENVHFVINSSTNDILIIKITDAKGRLLENQKIQIESGSTIITVNTLNWASGAYFVRLESIVQQNYISKYFLVGNK